MSNHTTQRTRLIESAHELLELAEMVATGNAEIEELENVAGALVDYIWGVKLNPAIARAVSLHGDRWSFYLDTWQRGFRHRVGDATDYIVMRYPRRRYELLAKEAAQC